MVGFISGTIVDTKNIALSDFKEKLYIKKPTLSYGSYGEASLTWTTASQVSGDIQPVDGKTIIAEVGREEKTTHRVFLEYDVDIKSGDRIYQVGGTYYKLNYIRRYEDHLEVYVIKVEKE